MRGKQLLICLVAMTLIGGAVERILPQESHSAIAAVSASATPTCPGSLQGYSPQTSGQSHHGELSRASGGRPYDSLICEYGPPVQTFNYTLRMDLNWVEGDGVNGLVCSPDTGGVGELFARVNSTEKQSTASISLTGAKLTITQAAIDAAQQSLATIDAGAEYCPGKEPTETAPAPTPPPPTDTTPQPAPAAPADDCSPYGWVIDHTGKGVPYIVVDMQYGKAKASTTTDPDGKFLFPSLQSFDEDDRPKGDEFDPNEITFALHPNERRSNPGRFDIRTDTIKTPVLYRKAFSPTDGCTQNIDMRDLASLDSDFSTPKPVRWPHILDIYQGMLLNYRLADHLNIDDLDYGMPVPIYADCDLSITKQSGAIYTCPTGGHFVGTGSSSANVIADPHIAFALGITKNNYAAAPDNRELHEFGHYFLADLLGNRIPLGLGHVKNHSGYYINRDSSDSLAEGFAEFWALLFKHELGDPKGDDRFYMYRLGGSMKDLEANARAWEDEEFAIAGLLLDLIDSNKSHSTFKRYNLKILSTEVEELYPDYFWVLGEVRNAGKDTVTNPQIVAEFSEDGKVVRTIPGTVFQGRLESEEVGTYAIPVPSDLVHTSVKVRSGALSFADDDPVSRGVDPGQLIAALETHKTLYPGHSKGGHLVNVVDLYHALDDWFVKSERTITKEDLDDLFVLHGLFEDTHDDVSNKQLDPGEEIGMTSHVANPAAGGDEMLERPSTPAKPATVVTLNATAGDLTDVVAMVTVEYANHTETSSAGHAYFTPLDPENRIVLDIPPKNVGGKIYVSILYGESLPQLVGSVDVSEFWKHAEKHGTDTSYLNFDVDPGSGKLRLPHNRQLTPIGVLLLVIGVGSGIAFILIRRRPDLDKTMRLLAVGIGVSTVACVGGGIAIIATNESPRNVDAGAAMYDNEAAHSYVDNLVSNAQTSSQGQSATSKTPPPTAASTVSDSCNVPSGDSLLKLTSIPSSFKHGTATSKQPCSFVGSLANDSPVLLSAFAVNNGSVDEARSNMDGLTDEDSNEIEHHFGGDSDASSIMLSLTAPNLNPPALDNCRPVDFVGAAVEADHGVFLVQATGCKGTHDELEEFMVDLVANSSVSNR